jgi:hypothetical protein
MEQSLYDAYKLLDREIKGLASKNSISPAEMENMYKAVCTMEKIKKIESMERQPEFSERASYGYGVGGYFPLSYDGNSGARGRDNMGRFTSMDGRMMGGMSNDGRMMGNASNDGYSGHSVRDRMIDRLERMRDEAQSESERREIQMEIDKMRMGG